MKILCLIPAYNERGNIEPLVKLLHRSFSSLSLPYFIFFIIQGNDGSAQLLETLKKRYGRLDFISFPKPLGIGRAYREGFHHINKSFSHILTMDADLNHDPDDLSKFLEIMKKMKADIVIGSRFMKQGKFSETRRWKRLASMALNRLLVWLFKLPVNDISSGYRLIRIHVIKEVRDTLHENGYPAYMEFILRSHKQGFSLHEVPITYTPRVWGKSKMNAIKTCRDYMLFLFKLVFRC